MQVALESSRNLPLSLLSPWGKTLTRISLDIKKDNSALLAYRGYMKFLESDLATFFRERGMGKSAARKHSSEVARDKAFSALMASKFSLSCYVKV